MNNNHDTEYQIMKKCMVGEGMPVFILERWADAANIYRDVVFIEYGEAKEHLEKYENPRVMVAAYLDLLKIKILEGKIPVFLNGQAMTAKK